MLGISNSGAQDMAAPARHIFVMAVFVLSLRTAAADTPCSGHTAGLQGIRLGRVHLSAEFLMFAGWSGYGVMFVVGLLALLIKYKTYKLQKNRARRHVREAHASRSSGSNSTYATASPGVDLEMGL